LGRAARTEAQLEAYLERIGYSAGVVAATVVRCRELGYVGDATYARERARGLRARGAGSLRIVADLEARGLPEALIFAAVEESRAGESEHDWARRALATLGRRRGARMAPAKAWRFLLARGFSEETIRALVPEPEGA